jgi:hypothetical protein
LKGSKTQICVYGNLDGTFRKAKDSAHEERFPSTTRERHRETVRPSESAQEPRRCQTIGHRNGTLKLKHGIGFLRSMSKHSPAD